MKNYVNLNNSGQGFIEGNKSKSSEWLAKFKEIPVSCFKSPFQSFDFSDYSDVIKKRKFHFGFREEGIKTFIEEKEF